MVVPLVLVVVDVPDSVTVEVVVPDVETALVVAIIVVRVEDVVQVEVESLVYDNVRVVRVAQLCGSSFPPVCVMQNVAITVVTALLEWIVVVMGVG